MVLIYKCPNCGGNMTFDPQKQLLHCDYCGNESKVEDVETEEREGDVEQNLSNTKVYECPNCGAEIITDEYTAATYCAYCGAATILSDRLSNVIKPQSVIPFKYDRDFALDKIKKWCHGGLFTPSDFLNANNIQKLSGIYVPFWLYDFKTNADVEANCTKVRTYIKGDYRYTETSHYIVRRNIDAEFNRIPLDSSIKMDDNLMGMLEPFDYNGLQNFEMGYLSGYMAEKFNYSSQDLIEKAKKQAKDGAYNIAVREIKGYSTVNVKHRAESADSTKIEYSLLPVWLYKYTYKGKEYVFAMNGQTGKVVGKPPVSTSKAVIVFLTLFIAILSIVYILVCLMGGGL